MKKQYIPYVNAVSSLSIPVYDRGRVIAAAVAQAVACNMQMPTGAVTSAQEYYDANVRSQVMGIVSEFNEHAVLNGSLALDFVRSFWMMRYDAIVKCPVRKNDSVDYFHSFFGVYDYFSESDISFFNENAEVIFDIYTSICTILAEALDTNVTDPTAAAL